ncbi:MAG: hypothetical protein U1E50_00370 [Caulobacteraceae bacterium]
MAAPAPSTAAVLDGARIVATLERLLARIEDRFAGSGLSRVCTDLVATARASERRAMELGKPYLGLRIGVAFVVVAFVLLLVALASQVSLTEVRQAGLLSLASGLESVVNLGLLAFAAIWFLMTLEARIKRGAAHKALSELRAFAHVIDMHQLTKDPSVVRGASRPTASSPKREMSEFELARYLDYCAEMLALIAKLAALYQRELPDPEIGAAVNDVESLASDLGRKIWQKITLIGQLTERPS